MITALPYVFGGPPARGLLRVEPDDFRVEEELGFEPSGHGEHAFLLIEKTGANTDWVARQLASAAGVAPVAVGYAGLKDRHAVTRQSFSVQLPGKADPDWSTLDIPGVSVLSAARHNRKLKRGAHRGNRFRIRLRNVSGDVAAIEARLASMRLRGVPNYFGEQRFGVDGRNLELAAALFAGRRLPRDQRGFALSAARSQLFNDILASRVVAGNWDQALPGEVWMLGGSHAIFGPEALTEALRARLDAFDIHPTGAMWGRGELRSTDEVRALEASVAAGAATLAEGLERAGLEQERRALRLSIGDLDWIHDPPNSSLVVEFRLGAGAFATSVLRELCEWNQGPCA